ncbi:SH3 domain-containing protein [Vibrio parahaemolyticus]|uniref:SH3 domain-containing protein n=1 Tax=Vibrio parahaemolyticus TaxID=670 RepID=UPI000B1FE615|nr:SH3 domain-containing protein [Vibrio parahaemolyticus]QGG33323.1 SH3 domain-containing protein [Vibrio parahaemolyticus 10329]EGQ7774688.1 SH3 domain-containing protein [Vibrio parahaemolyticus]EGQ7805620.1 SH3 domain-containing protein [Vibrio parahaemolyticus]EGQ7864025.1 SH3 domain-containing protein [Vibrio parahaemolyticus]
MKYKILLVLFLGLTVGFNAQAKICKKGQPCGNSCISWKKTCRIGTYSSKSYSSSKSVTSVKSPKYKSQNELSAGDYEVTATKLNVRDNPFSSKEVVGTLSKGQRVYVHSFVSDWAMIRYKSSFYWVSKKYLKRMS